jgi:hypothetical protein
MTRWRWLRRIAMVMLLVPLVGVPMACRQRTPTVFYPAVGQQRYVCCNLRYEKDRVSERNRQQGTVLPVGTPVRIDEVLKNRVVFKPEGAPILMLFFEGKEGYLQFDEYLDRVFLTEDPQLKLARVPEKIAAAIRQATVLPGMTRDQVLMAVGYPPADLTPMLTSPNWRYPMPKDGTLEVFFDRDTVARVSQQ